jgi:hypothetical protein
LLSEKAQPGAAADLACAWSLRRYVLRGNRNILEPSHAQPARRLSARPLGSIKGRHMEKYFTKLAIDILSQPSLLISCFQSIIGLIALIFAIIELPKIRKDLAFKKMEGIMFIRDWLNREELLLRQEEIIAAFKEKTANKEYPIQVDSQIIGTMSDLEQIYKLIKMNYIEKKDFLQTFASQLFLLAWALNNFVDRNNSKMPGYIARYPNSIKIIKDIIDETFRSDRAAADRISKFV